MYNEETKMKPSNTLFSIQALIPAFRGYLWNFRDAATVNPLMRPGYIFRTSSLTRYQNKSFFIPLIAHLRLTGIIDLRTDEEKSENPYLAAYGGVLKLIFKVVDCLKIKFRSLKK